MNWDRKRKQLKLSALLLGALTGVLRCALYASAVDEKNLLVSGNLFSILVWASAAVAAVVLILGAVQQSKGVWTDDSTRTNPAGALGAVILSAAIAFTVYFRGTPVTVVEKLCSAVGLLCVPCLLAAAFCRLKGRKPFFLCHGCVCVFFALYLVASYSSWSANPQFQDYVFSLLCCAALALFAYQQTALDVDMGSGKLQFFMGIAALYLGVAAIYSMDHPWLYLAGGIWAMTNLSHPAPAAWYRYAQEGR